MPRLVEFLLAFLLITQESVLIFSVVKCAFKHPVSACVYRIVLRFPSTYVGLLMSMEKKLLLLKHKAMLKMHAGTGCDHSAVNTSIPNILNVENFSSFPFIYKIKVAKL